MNYSSLLPLLSLYFDIVYGVSSSGGSTSSTLLSSLSSSSSSSLSSLFSCSSSGYTSVVGLIVKMGVGAYITSYTPVVFKIPLLVATAAAISLGSSVLVSTTVTGPGVSFSSSTSGKSAANSGWFPGYVSIRPSRSFLFSQSKYI